MNTVSVPKNVLKAFIQLSNQKPRNTELNYTSKLDNDLLLVDVDGKRVTLTHTNRLWFVQLVSYSYDTDAYDGHWCLEIKKLKQIDTSPCKGADACIPLVLESMRYVGLPSDYLKDLNFDLLLTNQVKGKKHAYACSYDTGLLGAVTRFFSQTGTIVRVVFPIMDFEPLYLHSGEFDARALIMPVRS